MMNAGPHANIPDHPDPVAPQKFADVELLDDGDSLFFYDELSARRQEWVKSDAWVDSRDHR